MGKENEGYTSIDDMLGRSSNKQKQLEVATEIPSHILKEAKEIGKTVKSTITRDEKPVLPSNKKSFVESVTKKSSAKNHTR